MAVVDITVQNDADFYRVFQYVVAGEIPTPIDITGASMEMMLRRRAEDAVALMRLGTDTGEIVLIDPALGKFTIMIRQADLLMLGLGEFDQSCIMTLNDLKTRLWSGTLTNNAGPTR
jgi:hypothetical protein